MIPRAKPNSHSLFNYVSKDRLGVFYNQTHLFYDKCSSVYEVLYPDHLDFSKKIFDKIFPILRENGVKNILDASCGIGYDIETLSSYNEFNLCGSDSSEKMVSMAKNRLERCGLNIKISTSDARDFQHNSSCIHDLILFRGNTLSNLDYGDYDKVLANFSNALRPGGLLLIDFRDGIPHYSSRDNFEFRGFKYDKANGKMFVSWYYYSIPEKISDPFKVSAYILEINISHLFPTLSLNRLEINSNYVIKDNLVESLHNNGFNVFWEHSDDEGLPFLVTYLCKKQNG